MINRKPDYRKTYWSGKGKHEALKDALEALIPPSGEVANASDNPKLERYRRAANCYYDLYNNGLCNRAKEFEEIFGFWAGGEFTQEVVNDTEKAMNRIIREAAKEQKIAEVK